MEFIEYKKYPIPGLPYDLENKAYDSAQCIVLCRVKEPFGDLLNMSSTFHMIVNGTIIRSVEALYQCCRFPFLPRLQKQLIDTPSPLWAKRSIDPFKPQGRSDWYQVKVKFMHWCLRVKLACNYDKMGGLLDRTGDKTIVETSPDVNFWGAVHHHLITEDYLLGANIFGQLLMELRNDFRNRSKIEMMDVKTPDVQDLLLFGEPIHSIGALQTQSKDDLCLQLCFDY